MNKPLHYLPGKGLVVLMIFLLCVTVLQAQQRTISGKVTDGSNGLPLVGGTVQIKGTTLGTITDIDGMFEIDVSGPEDILVFSFVGLTAQEIVVGDQQYIEITMEVDISELDEIVVIGYGTKRKEDLTGSVTVVSTEDLAKSTATTLSKALQGKAAGVYIKQSSGAPGSGAAIRIRGIGSINANPDPLIVVDGVPGGSLNHIDPDDIESFQVLKDASASAIYGARAANGVILIQTKRGQSGKTTVTFDAQMRRVNLPQRLDLMNAEKFKEWVDAAYLNAPSSINKPTAYSDSVISIHNTDTDWQEEMIHPVWEQNYHLRLSGGSERANYSFSGNYYSGEGNINYSKYDRYVFRANSDFNVTDKLKVGESAAITYIKSEGAGGSIGGAYPPCPLMKVYEPLAKEGLGYAGPTDSITGNNDKTNPIAESELRETYSNSMTAFGNLYAEYQIVNGLKIKANLGFEKYFRSGSTFIPQYLLGNIGNRMNPISSRNMGTNNNTMWLTEYFLTYQNTFGNHNVSGLAGYSAQAWHNENYNATGTEFVDPEVVVWSQAQIYKDMSGTETDRRFLSQFFRVTYDFKGKYLVTANMRRDGSSRFGPENRWGFFPSASVGWKINEDFLQNVQQINMLKLRAGYGVTGNENFQDYVWINTMDQPKNSQYVFGVNQETYFGNRIYANFANPTIQWEETLMTNIGIDLNAFANRLQVSAEYYIKDQRKMLVRRPIAVALGRHTSAAQPWVNLGNVVNRGLDLHAEFKNRVGNFEYSAGFTLTTIHNEVKKLAEDKPIRSGVTYTEVGKPIGSFFGSVSDGILQIEDFVLDNNGDPVVDENGNYTLDGLPFQTEKTAPGDIKFKDLNHDAVINDFDRTYIGKPIPDFVYGINFEVSWKNLSLYIFLNGIHNMDIYNNLNRSINIGTDVSNRDVNKLTAVIDNAWTPENPTNEYTRIAVLDENLNTRTSEWFIEDASFLRIQDIQLSYQLPPSVTNPLKLSGLSLYASVSNLGFVFNNYSGLDPEAGGSSPLSSNIDSGGYPMPRTFIFGVRMNY